MVTPSPVGPAIENDSTPSPPRPSPAVHGPLTTKMVQSMILPIRDMTVVSREWRMAVWPKPVLALLGQGDGSVDVRDADERDERHHLLVLDERVLGAGLGEEELGPLGDLDPGVLAQDGRVLADQVLVDVQRPVVPLLEGGLRQGIDLARP